MKKLTPLFIIFLIFINIVSALDWGDLTEEEKRNYAEEIFKDNFKVSVSAIPKSDFIPSALSTVVIDDPFASAGQPVLVEFTLYNRGDTFPFDQIPLPPDSFGLFMGVDNNPVFIDKNGNAVDVSEYMTALQKFFYTISVGLEGGAKFLIDMGKGAQCTYVNVWDNLPSNTKTELQSAYGTINGVFAWDCMKITDKISFDRQVKRQCRKEGFDAACMSKLNSQGSVSLRNWVFVKLSSKPKGQCGFYSGKTPISFFAKNLVECGIGQNGLMPQEEVKVRFIIIVPADTPMLSQEGIENLPDLDRRWSANPSCLNSAYPRACHTLNTAVFPIQKDSLPSIFVDHLGDLLTISSCFGSKVLYGAGSSFDTCFRNKVGNLDPIGEAIYEASGTFYVLPPDLDGRARLIMIALLLSGFATTGAVLLGKKK